MAHMTVCINLKKAKNHFADGVRQKEMVDIVEIPAQAAVTVVSYSGLYLCGEHHNCIICT